MADDHPLIFFDSDFCPFAQRVRIALEERAIPYDHRIVNFFNRELPETQLFLSVNPGGTVPAAVHQGSNLHESLLINEYLEDAFPNHKSLYPGTPAAKFRVRQLIKKHGDAVVPAFYTYLRVTPEADPERKDHLQKALLDKLAAMSADLATGPFFLGDQFTLADCTMFPFLERIMVILPHYYDFAVPRTDEFAGLHRWYNACRERPALARTLQDRGAASMQTLPFAAQARNEYLIEAYEVYAKNAMDKARVQLALAPPGVRSLVF